MFSRGMSEELKQFYKNRSKNPDKFQYDADGNLVELDKEGGVVKTITLPTYRNPTLEELDLLEKDRMAAIAIATKEYDDAYNALHQEYQKIERLDSTILQLNRKVMEADTNLQHIRFPLRYISKEDGIEIRKLDFDKPTETRKFIYDIAVVYVNPFTLEDQYVRIGQAAPKPMVSVVEAKEALARNVPIILFSDIDTNDYGFLSLDWPVEIQLNGTMYHSAKQAIAAEIAKRFNDEKNLSRIMLADTPDEITYSLDDVPGDKDANQVKWNDYTKQLIYDVNTAKFNQFPELRTRLLETKNAVLGSYLPNDNLIGIGISLDNIQSKNPLQWTGQNILGKALMEIRESIRAQQLIQQESQGVSLPKRKKKPGVSISSTSTSISAPVPVSSLAAVPAPVPAPVPVPVSSLAAPQVAIAPNVSAPQQVASVEPSSIAPLQPRKVRARPGIGSLPSK